MRKVLLSAALLLAAGIGSVQGQSAVDWGPLARFIGVWKGTGDGQPGKGVYERSYSLVLGGRFIEIRNRSVYDPQPKNPKGEIHEDVGYFSFDKQRKSFVLRQFHVEGFVNQYKAEGIAEGAKEFAFMTESIENIPAGWRARESYKFTGLDKFVETFELAAPGKEFEIYTQVEFTRVK